MATAVVLRGRAAIEGTAGAFDCILYPIAQSLDLDQQWDFEEIKDIHGYDVAWLFRNERSELECNMKMVADTAAHAAAPVTAGNASSSVSAFGQPFLGPGSALVLTGFLLPALNKTFLVMSGTKVSQRNTQVADIVFKGRAYADSADQSVTTVPV